MSASLFSVYIVRCSDGTLYTGIAQDVKERIKEHNSGGVLGAKYTRSRTPVQLAYKEDGYTHGEALSREYVVKQLTRMEKEKLIRVRKTPVRKRVV